MIGLLDLKRLDINSDIISVKNWFSSKFEDLLNP